MILLCACAPVIDARGTTLGLDRPDPIIDDIPESAEASIESLAAWVKAREPEPFARVKVLHDWVAHHVRYDVAALKLPRIPDSDADAETVFHERRGVCAGYAHLLEALGRAAGLDIRYIVVDTEQGTHARNAVDIGGQEYSIDATWDAGTVGKDGFQRRYSTQYFLQPMGPSLRELVESSIRELEPLLDATWALPETTAARRAHILALWDQAAEPDDRDLGRAGERARLVIEAWIRLHIPEGSPDAFTSAEIGHYNHSRDRWLFDPYP